MIVTKIFDVDVFDIDASDLNDFDLWYDDLEEAGVSSIVIASDGEKIVGFQTINNDGRTIAIETLELYRGQGIGFLMILESGSYKPERNENRDFWEHVAELYENY